MYYLHLKLDEGFFPHPEDIEDALESEVPADDYFGEVYFSVYDRGIIAVMPRHFPRYGVRKAIRHALYVAKYVNKRTEDYKFKITYKWRK